MKRLFFVFWGVLLFITGCQSSIAEEKVSEKVFPVEVMAVSPGSIQSELIYAGQVKPSEQMAVVSKIAGKVKSVFFDVGDTVSKDDVLFYLDEKDISNNIKVIEAQLASAQAAIDSANTGLVTATGGQSESTKAQLEGQISLLETQLSQAESNLKLAEQGLSDATLSFENNKALFDAGIVPKSQFDQVESAFNAASEKLTQAQLAYDSVATSLDQAKDSYDIYVNQIVSENVQRAQDAVNSAIAGRDALVVQLANARDALNDTAVRSPISGVVSSRNVDAGGMIGQSAAFVIVNLDVVSVNVNVSEQIINSISVGDSVDVFIKSIGEDVITGRISQISPAADERLSTFPVKIEIDNSDGVLKPGMFAEIHFVKQKSLDTVVIPRSACLDDEYSSYVYVVSNGFAKKITVTTGIDNGKDIEILSGLSDEMRVVIKGQSYLRDGASVNVVTSKED